MHPNQPNPQPGFFPFPYMGWPIGAQGPPPLRPNEVPARVQLAMEYLKLLVMKEGTGAIASHANAGMAADVIELVPGLPLSPPEEVTRGAACDLLEAYFAGKLSLDTLEKVWLERMKPPQEGNLKPDGPGRVIKCLHCQGIDPGRRSCQLCNGCGDMIVYPLSQSEGET